MHFKLCFDCYVVLIEDVVNNLGVVNRKLSCDRSSTVILNILYLLCIPAQTSNIAFAWLAEEIFHVACAGFVAESEKSFSGIVPRKRHHDVTTFQSLLDDEWRDGEISDSWVSMLLLASESGSKSNRKGLTLTYSTIQKLLLLDYRSVKRWQSHSSSSSRHHHHAVPALRSAWFSTSHLQRLTLPVLPTAITLPA